MKEIFDYKLRLNTDNKYRLNTINNIIEDYSNQGYKLTLRQLYYQLVAKAIIPNQVEEYQKLSKLLTKGRMAGIVDWDAIEDRIRKPKRPYFVDDPKDAMKDTINMYELDRMRNQNIYIELWVEKDAISNILYNVTKDYGINLMVNRGYSSVTAIYDSYRRFKRELDRGKEVKIMYLGDHDPSGLDMVRDINDRVFTMLTGDSMQKAYEDKVEVYQETPEFDKKYEVLKSNKDYLIKIDRKLYFNTLKVMLEDKFNVEHLALTKEQIDKYDPPPNPAKLTDTRASEYVKKHGYSSWEVDALSPKILHDLIQTKIENTIDLDLYQEILDQEDIDKNILDKIKI